MWEGGAATLPRESTGQAEEGKEVTGPGRPILPYSAMFFLSSTNPVRVVVHKIVTYPMFDTCIMVIIALR